MALALVVGLLAARQHGAAVIRGEMTADERGRAEKAIRADPETRIPSGTPAASHEGLTPTKADAAACID